MIRDQEIVFPEQNVLFPGLEFDPFLLVEKEDSQEIGIFTIIIHQIVSFRQDEKTEQEENTSLLTDILPILTEV